MIGVGVILVDITEREEAKDFRSAVMDTIVEGLYVLDGDGRLTFMNTAASRLLGWTEAELRGRSMHEAIHFQHADGSPHSERDCELLKVRTEGRAIRMSHEAFTCKDGTICPVAYSAAPLMAGTRVGGVVVVFRDTRLENAEEDKASRELDALVWVGRIRDALDEDRLVLHSQPIVPLAGGAPSQELLLRMAGADGEIFPPSVFLPVAEKYGLIGEIDRWVIAEAIRLAATGQRVEANLSADSIGRLDMLALIEREIRDSGADPSNVVFEITETALMENIEVGEAFTRGLSRARLPGGPRRFRNRLRQLHLPEEAADRLSEDRHRLRARPRDQPRQSAPRHGDRRPGERLRLPDHRRGGRGRRDLGPPRRLWRRLRPRLPPRRPAAAGAMRLQYAVYIALPTGDDAEKITDAAEEMELPGFPFSIREHSDPSESKDAELSFRVTGVAGPEEALERALQVYEAARETAGLKRDGRVEPSLLPVPRPA